MYLLIRILTPRHTRTVARVLTGWAGVMAPGGCWTVKTWGMTEETMGGKVL